MESDGTNTSNTQSTDDSSLEKDFFGWRLMQEFDFKKEDILGRGGFGSVYKCVHLVDKMSYAIKIIPFNEADEDRSLREAEIMALMKHQNVNRYHTAWVEDGFNKEHHSSPGSNISASSSETLFLQMEFCPMTLRQKIENILNEEKEKAFDELAIWVFLLQMAKGVEHIHQMGVIHGDLSIDNIFLDDCDAIRIADFGLSIKIKEGNEFENCTPSHGNLVYRAPEVLKGYISQKSDIYQLGLIFFEMLYRISTNNERFKALRNVREAIFPEGWKQGEEDTDFINLLLRPDPADRPAIAEIVKHLDDKIKRAAVDVEY